MDSSYIRAKIYQKQIKNIWTCYMLNIFNCYIIDIYLFATLHHTIIITLGMIKSESIKSSYSSVALLVLFFGEQVIAY